MENEINTLNPFTAPTSPNQQFMRFFYDTFAVIGPDRATSARRGIVENSRCQDCRCEAAPRE